MSAADVIVLPSYGEGLPTVLVEAGSLGLPVIATAVGGIPELLGTDRGIVLAGPDATALADALRGFADRPRGGGRQQRTGSTPTCSRTTTSPSTRTRAARVLPRGGRDAAWAPDRQAIAQLLDQAPGVVAGVAHTIGRQCLGWTSTETTGSPARMAASGDGRGPVPWMGHVREPERQPLPGRVRRTDRGRRPPAPERRVGQELPVGDARAGGWRSRHGMPRRASAGRSAAAAARGSSRTRRLRLGQLLECLLARPESVALDEGSELLIVVARLAARPRSISCMSSRSMVHSRKK